MICSGFTDLQVNGFGGIDFNRPETTLPEIEHALNTIIATGVTRCLPTIITGPPDDMLACLRTLTRARTELNWGQVIAGFHIEGPHISPDEGPRGAHPIDAVRPPDVAEYRTWQQATNGAIRIITLSPHWPEAPDYIRAITADGVVASIGHTGATAAQIDAAIEAGATMSTHIGNAGHSMLPKTQSYIWDQLAEDRLTGSFIADGIHVARPFLKAAIRAKTPARAVLVTDASAPAGAPPGRYRLGRQDADLLPDGRVVLAGSTRLAGSSLSMHDAISNVMQMTGISLEQALAMATTQPADMIHLEERNDKVEFHLNEANRVVIDSVHIDGKQFPGK